MIIINGDEHTVKKKSNSQRLNSLFLWKIFTESLELSFLCGIKKITQIANISGIPEVKQKISKKVFDSAKSPNLYNQRVAHVQPMSGSRYFHAEFLSFKEF